MAILKIKPFVVPKSEDTTSELEKKKVTKLDSILQTNKHPNYLHYVGGYRWKVTYYNRRETTSSLTENFDIEASPTEVSYTKINSMELILDSVLEGEINELTGSAIITSAITPTTGDMFIGTLSDGKEVGFDITDVEKLNYRDDDSYKINFSYYQLADDEFKEKVEQFVKTQLFTVQDGKESIIVTPEVKDEYELLNNSIERLNTIYKSIIKDTNMQFKVGERLVQSLEFNYFVTHVMDFKTFEDMDNEIPTVEPIFDIVLFPFIKDVKFIPNLIKPYFNIRPYSSSYVLDVHFLSSRADILYVQYEKPNNGYKLLESTHSDLPKLGDDEFLLNVNGDSLLEKTLFSDSVERDSVIQLYKGFDTWSRDEMFFYTPFLVYLIKKLYQEYKRS